MIKKLLKKILCGNKGIYPVDTYDAGIRSKLFNELVEEYNQFGEYYIDLMFDILIMN